MTSAAAAPPAPGSKNDTRRPVLFALMLSTGLVALDSTIVATAVPSIVEQLGGFAQFPWLFSIYLLTQAVTAPLYGKFADVVGRRPVLLAGIGLFTLGSVLCGIAWSMPTLILARGVQGLGAGAVLPICITVVGDLYDVSERGRVQGYMASVWGLASVVGPTLGGVFSDFLSWRWIFWINLPLAATAAYTLLRKFHEKVEHRSHKLDYAGSVTLVTGCSLLILGLLEGGTRWSWSSATSIAIFVAAGVLLLVFGLVERRAAEPVLPLWIFRRRVLLAGNLGSLCVGAITLGLSSYIPTYAQGVKGTGALIAGFTVAALTVGWPLAATFSGRVYGRIGFRDTALIGTVLLVAGTVWLVLVQESSSLLEVAAACFVVGAGLGFAATAVTVAVQSVVGWERRGVVTGASLFMRSIGSAVGVAVFGALANSLIASRLASPPVGVAGQLPASHDAGSLVLDSTPRPSMVEDFLRATLFDATHVVFWGLLVVAILAGLVVALMPRRTRQLQFTD